MSLEELIDECIRLKRGDSEFMLHRWSDGTWIAAIGNKSEHVPIGESIAYGETNVDFCASEYASATEAMTALLQQIKN
jgi:hypothetical protein